jgi:hypothetical protein
MGPFETFLELRSLLKMGLVVIPLFMGFWAGDTVLPSWQHHLHRYFNMIFQTPSPPTDTAT